MYAIRSYYESKTIGMFLTTGLTHPFFSRVVVGLEKALKETGYDLLYLVQFDMGSDYRITSYNVCYTKLLRAGI